MSSPPRTPAPKNDDELVQADDAVIGRALRTSGLILGTLLVAGLIVFLIVNRESKEGPGTVTTNTPPVIPQRPLEDAPQITFTDVTQPAGIDFVHNNGATGDKLLPETMGGGVAFFDADSDGDPDLLFINSTDWPWKPGDGTTPQPHALYANDGKGHFTNVTAGSGLDVAFYGMGVAVGDYDNDGRTDVFVSAVGRNHLFRNRGGGKFEDVTEAAGVGGSEQEWSTSCSWLDIDNDGDLDLFVANYVRWSKAIDLEVGYKIDGTTRAYGQPMNFEGTYPYLYENKGDGTFTDVSAASGVQVRNNNTGLPMAKSLGVAPVELDGDDWIDLVVANDTVHNFVFRNKKDGTFEEIGALTGIAFDSYGNTRGAMGIDTAWFRNDNALGIGIGNFANEMTALYVSQNNPLIFSDEAITEGIGPASRLLLKFGLFFFDYDLDGRQDVLTANGHLEEEISTIQQSQTYEQPAQLFWNTGSDRGPTFVSVTATEAGEDLFHPMVGRGSAYADMDGDGDLDVVLTQVGGPPRLLRNDQDLGHHWVRLKLEGARANRDAIGARVRLTTGEITQTRQVMPTRSYLSQSELVVSFGLAKAARVDSVQIQWPGGATQTINNTRIDALTRIRQPK